MCQQASSTCANPFWLLTVLVPVDRCLELQVTLETYMAPALELFREGGDLKNGGDLGRHRVYLPGSEPPAQGQWH